MQDCAPSVTVFVGVEKDARHCFFHADPSFSSTLSFPGEGAIKHVSALCMFY